MVKLEMEINNEEIKKVKIRGDFFLEPPEKLNKLEDKIKELKIDSTAEEVSENLKDVEADLIGFSTSDVGKAFRKALDEGDE